MLSLSLSLFHFLSIYLSLSPSLSIYLFYICIYPEQSTHKHTWTPTHQIERCAILHPHPHTYTHTHLHTLTHPQKPIPVHFKARNERGKFIFSGSNIAILVMTSHLLFNCIFRIEYNSKKSIFHPVSINSL